MKGANMLINDVESIVGLSKKSIRYYEEHNLIHPKRNNENGYRIYDEEDIKTLKTIKFLRELGVSIKELEELLNGDYSLRSCMEDRIHKIQQEEDKYKKVKSLCEDIYEANDTLESIDIDHYFQSMNVLNKEGFSMKKIKEEHNKKIRLAITTSIIVCTFFVAILCLLIWAQMQDPIPLVLWIFLACVICFPLIVIPFVLKERIQEIKRGEIDEASKY